MWAKIHTWKNGLHPAAWTFGILLQGNGCKQINHVNDFNQSTNKNEVLSRLQYATKHEWKVCTSHFLSRAQYHTKLPPTTRSKLICFSPLPIDTFPDRKRIARKACQVEICLYSVDSFRNEANLAWSGPSLKSELAHFASEKHARLRFQTNKTWSASRSFWKKRPFSFEHQYAHLQL